MRRCESVRASAPNTRKRAAYPSVPVALCRLTDEKLRSGHVTRAPMLNRLTSDHRAAVPRILLASLPLVVAGVALRRRSAAVPAVVGGVVLYVGM